MPVSPRCAVLGARLAAMIGTTHRFREQLRSLNSPFSENPAHRRRCQTQLSLFQERTRVGHGLGARARATDLLAELLAADVVQLFLADATGVDAPTACRPWPFTGPDRQGPRPRRAAGRWPAGRSPRTRRSYPTTWPARAASASPLWCGAEAATARSPSRSVDRKVRAEHCWPSGAAPRRPVGRDPLCEIPCRPDRRSPAALRRLPCVRVRALRSRPDTG